MITYNFILGALALALIICIILLVYIIKKGTKPKKPYIVSFNGPYKGTKVPLIKLKIRNKFHYFLVDTGANTSIIDARYYNGLPDNIKESAMEEDVQITGIGDGVMSHEGKDKVIRRQTQTQSISLDMSFGPYKYDNTIFIIADLRAPFMQLERVLQEPVIGLLGTDFIKQYQWSIDFKSMTITMPN